MHTGKYIVFEGTSGTGKETQAKLLSQYLTKNGHKNIIVYHPSPELKIILSDWRHTRHINHITETYLLLADRYYHTESIIKPALAQGRWVIGLRNYISALVYQAQNSRDAAWIRSQFDRFEPSADYLFYFDITPHAALRRIMSRHQSTGEELGKFETLELLNAKRRKYNLVMRAIPHIKIPAAADIPTIGQLIIKSVKL